MTRRASRSSRPTRARRVCSASQARPIRSTPKRSRWTSAPSSRASPGPSAPQDRVPLKAAKQGFAQALPGMMVAKKSGGDGGVAVSAPPQVAIDHGSVVIAAITSCTNTSNPSVMIGAGLVAKKAVEKGLSSKPWVKTSLAPGSKVVTDYLQTVGARPVSRSAGFQPRRLWLHDVHRQQRSASRRRFGRD